MDQFFKKGMCLVPGFLVRELSLVRGQETTTLLHTKEVEDSEAGQLSRRQTAEMRATCFPPYALLPPPPCHSIEPFEKSGGTRVAATAVCILAALVSTKLTSPCRCVHLGS